MLSHTLHTHAHTSLLLPLLPPSPTHMQSEFINMYSAYIGEFKVAMRTLARYEQSSEEFREVLQLLQNHPQCQGLSLASFLLSPVQRLPRYELLLKVTAPSQHRNSSK